MNVTIRYYPISKVASVKVHRAIQQIQGPNGEIIKPVSLIDAKKLFELHTDLGDDFIDISYTGVSQKAFNDVINLNWVRHESFIPGDVVQELIEMVAGQKWSVNTASVYNMLRPVILSHNNEDEEGFKIINNGRYPRS